MSEPVAAAPRRPLALRILRFPITLIVIEGIVFSLIGGPLESLGVLQAFGADPLKLFAIVVVGVIALILLWKAARRWLEGEQDREFTLPGAWREAGLGVVAGFALFTAMTGIVALLGGIAVSGTRPFAQTQFWAWAGVALASGVFEELLLRGVLLRQLERLAGTWIALAISAVVFGLLHLANPDATLVGAISIALEAGILLGAAYLYTRRLWLAAGLHGAWNFTQAWVFSVPVSGTGQPVGILVTERTGPEWLTGGDFGLEASLPSILVATLAGLFLLRLAYRRGNFVAAPWTRRSHEAVRVDVDADPHPLRER